MSLWRNSDRRHERRELGRTGPEAGLPGKPGREGGRTREYAVGTGACGRPAFRAGLAPGKWFFAMLFAWAAASGCAGSKPAQVKGADVYFEEGMKALKKKHCVEATEKFQRLVNNFPGSRLVPDAQYYLAESYFCSGDYVNAVFEYQRLIDVYPSSQWVDEAQFKIGESYYRQLRRPELDQKETYQALNYFRDFIADNPDSPLVETARRRIADCRERLAHKQYLNARLYQRQGYLKAAEMTYEELMRDYPDTSWYYHALLRMGEIARARHDLEKARLYWEQIERECGDAALKEKASEKLDKLRTARGE